MVDFTFEKQTLKIWQKRSKQGSFTYLGISLIRPFFKYWTIFTKKL